MMKQIICAFLLVGCAHPTPTPKTTTALPTSESTEFVREGEPLPTFALKTLSQQTMTSNSLVGKVVLINFWASYCGPCKAEFPALETLHKTYEPEGLTVLGISIDDTPEESQQVASQFGLTFTNLYGGESLYRQLGGKGTPFSVLVEKDKIIAKISGRRSEDFFEGLVWASLSLNPRSRIGAVQPKEKPTKLAPVVVPTKPLAKEANGWKLETVADYGNNFGAIFGVNRKGKDRIFLGGMGDIFYSDGDGNWKNSYRDNDSMMIERFWAVSSEEIYAVGSNCPILFSSDGGETWTALTADRYYLSAIWGSGANDIYASGDKGLLLHSTDKGKTWQKIDLGTQITLLSIWGSSANDIYIGAGLGIFFRSTDQGKTWQKTDSKQEGSIYDIWGRNADEIYAVGGRGKAGVILRSTDRGATWNLTEKSQNYFGSVLGFSSGEIWISGNNEIYRSRDKGNSWELVPAIPDAPVLFLWGSSPETIYTAGPYNTILRR